MTRKRINPKIEADILIDSRRRCCICFGLNNDLAIKKGQIAHLDQDNANNKYDNLAFLCFDHHDQYDSKTSQSKNFTITEVKRYKKELKDNLLTADKPIKEQKHSKLSAEEYKKEEIRQVLIEILSEMGTISKYSIIGTKTGLSRTEIENTLIELSQKDRVRIDRPKGSTRKTFSLKDSYENLIIDAFIKSLNTEVVREDRFLQKRQHTIDALVSTKTDCYLIEVRKPQYISSSRIETIINKIERIRTEFRIDDSVKSVLLIGINDKTKVDASIKEFADKGLMLKYVEINN